MFQDDIETLLRETYQLAYILTSYRDMMHFNMTSDSGACSLCNPGENVCDCHCSGPDNTPLPETALACGIQGTLPDIGTYNNLLREEMVRLLFPFKDACPIGCQ